MLATAAPRRALALAPSARIVAATAATDRRLSVAVSLYDPPDDLVALIAAETVIAGTTIIAGGP